MISRQDKVQTHDWKEEYNQYLDKLASKQEDYDYYVSVTRKGYYFSSLQGNLQNRFIKVKVLKDRDILKCFDFKEFYGKKILLFDDTSNTGETLRTLKQRLQDKTDNNIKLVDVSSFAASRRVKEDYKNIFGDNEFYSYCEMDDDEMSRFSLYELHEIHRNMLPYTVDLPCFEKLKLTEDQFYSLTQGEKDNWNFYDYSFWLQDEEYKNGFFLYENSSMERILGDALLVNLIKCRYCPHMENGILYYDVVLTPFVMLRSVYYHEMKKCFEILYKGTEYATYTIGEEGACSNYVGIYRDVVYNLSWFVGYMFQKYILQRYGVTLSWDETRLTNSLQNYRLNKSIHNIFDDLSIEQYMDRLGKCQFTYWKKTNVRISYQNISPFEEIKAYVLGQLSLQKLHEVENKENRFYQERGKADVLFEKIEDMIAQKFSFSNYRDFQLSFAKLILLALDCSFMSNNLSYENGEIKRIFSFGECSEIYFGYDIYLFYPAVYAFFNSVRASEEKYQEYYAFFINQLNRYLKVNSYFQYKYITKESFEFFSKYFNLKGVMITREIANKRFILDDKRTKNRYIKAVTEFVSNLKID